MSVASPILDASPDLAGIIQAYHDVTEQLKHSHELLRAEVIRLRSEIEEKNRELERRERLAALGQMAAGVAHEIRNPLGGIGLYVSLLERDLTDRPDQLEIVRRVRHGVSSMERVVGDILAFAGESALRFDWVCLGDVLDGVLSHARARVQSLGATIDIDPVLKTVRLSCDAGQIERALLNLVFNALDAAGSGGRVWVRLDRGRCSASAGTEKGNPCLGDGGDWVNIAVEDNGPGVEPSKVHQVFNPFFTTKDNGTGLGLAIVHRVAEAHGGSIQVRNRAEGGASFVLSLLETRGCEVVGTLGVPCECERPRRLKPAAHYPGAPGAHC